MQNRSLKEFRSSEVVQKEKITLNKTPPQEEVLKYFCVQLHGAIFITFPQPFLNITPKADMLQISFFDKDIPVIMPKKRINFTSTSY